MPPIEVMSAPPLRYEAILHQNRPATETNCQTASKIDPRHRRKIVPLMRVKSGSVFEPPTPISSLNNIAMFDRSIQSPS